MKSSLEKAIEIVGSQAALARTLKVSDEAVRKWRRKRIPAERVLQIEAATGGRVDRHDLRPDLYPEETNNDA